MMEQLYTLNDLQVNIELASVLNLINCTPDSPVYNSVADEFNKIHSEICRLAEPIGILGFGTISDFTATKKYPSGTKIIYSVLSIGDKIKQYSSQAFADGDYLRGMLSNSMADCALFSLECALTQKLKDICKKHNIGIEARLEAPQDISIEIQKEACDSMKLKERFGIDVSSGYMLTPIKTSCQIFVISNDAKKFNAKHDCGTCSNANCQLRKKNLPQIKVLKNNDIRIFSLKENETLMDSLIREGFYVNAICGGTGRCGKCKVRVLKGNAKISFADKTFFSHQELEDGMRLSCTLRPTENLTVSLNQNDESSFDIVSDYTYSDEKSTNKPHNYNIAVDIGTTTIAFQLLDNSEIIHTVTAINHQRQYGTDVISRIHASIAGKGNELMECIKADLSNGIIELCEVCGISIKQVLRIVIACNTTMGHLLLGYSCESLGKYPFTPVTTDFIRGSADKIIGINSNTEVILLPGISAFVGGDIVSGLYFCGFDQSKDICLLVDLGTNGEMALGNSDKILVTSTAAGPAFEGGNISCGIGSIDGAICSVKLNGSNSQVQTIREKPPIGICGTGVIELTAELLREKLLDETGLLDDTYFDAGFPVAKAPNGNDILFTQKDVRELQLAKAAIRAGIETLIKKYGITKNHISKVFIAGGFGYRLDAEKAIAIGMLPDEFSGRTQAIGNSSLAGIIKYLKEPNLHRLIEISEEINLSTDDIFNELYMESMMFPK